MIPREKCLEWRDEEGMSYCDDPLLPGLINRAYAEGQKDSFTCEYCGGNDETPQDHCMDCERPNMKEKP